MNKKRIEKTIIILIIVLVIILIVATSIINKKSSQEGEIQDSPKLNEDDNIELKNDDEEVENEVTNVVINSEELKGIVNNDWKAQNLNIGTIESTAQEYDIYFDEGIKIRTVAGKVYNIVFTERYKKNVVNNLKTTASKEEIIKTLGTPSFEAAKEEIDVDSDTNNDKKFEIGYKGKDIYVFFSEQDISIYKNQQIDNIEEIEKILQDFGEEKEVSEFAFNLTELWNDFNYFDYSEDFLDLRYDLRGVRVSWGIGAKNGIELFNNSSKELLSFCKQNDAINSILTIKTEDSVWEDETQRYMQDNYSKSGSFDEDEIISNGYISEKFYIKNYYTNDGKYYKTVIKAFNKDYPDREIKNDEMNSYIWYDDNIFYYGVTGLGLYRYNCQTGEKNVILDENRQYQIKKIEDNYLFFDDVKVKI